MQLLHVTGDSHSHLAQDFTIGLIVLAAVMFLAWRLLRTKPDAGCSSGDCHSTSNAPSKLMRPESLVRDKR